MQTHAVVFEQPQRIGLRQLDVAAPGDGDVVVETIWSGISAGTEKLLFEGRMPQFPGMGYPLVPGYESVGRVVSAGSDCPGDIEGRLVFVPGARGYEDAAALFGASASRLVTASDRVIPIDEDLARDGTLLSLAATAYHALTLPGMAPPDLVIGHGIVGRLTARLIIAMGNPAPHVWEINPARRHGAAGYEVTTAEACGNRKWASVLDASGDPDILDKAIAVLARGGEITLAGFYSETMSFRFTPAFMREAHVRIAAEFRPADVHAVLDLLARGRLSLDGLITHSASPGNAGAAYRTAFGDPDCLKMILDWRELQ
ncbi:MAG: chlorophyll synthesis pathway protein BchC [Hoeflea sp.]|uniref:chlorophyll synthesis pathway protein BchC n=1 Tax=Hoeflea sp. TaxID=1940281 RepID=UPI001DDC5B3A|nr:chlorophyll synthesis pathway protein BchC [Hoeflea sp.]MBU4527838.1 chlorophyll synthesis pathway protein BchC [Alphaproteobacteria bacterium]MBU4546127.1 chlorophyll synthesis pathway protein BchC [Alphaproteobacteria bacterium]MBU4553188.1 chlorophyll synthesis pathway protein BchC [Alphaproteobacteria bacterium]MBV1724260.1 chlorophyll synthesis pathway protein BchC [Hoeflea sp.]MBV1759945.1 chlorophyll synthesis pathway protein BchC [Hoeflea sp.]